MAAIQGKIEKITLNGKEFDVDSDADVKLHIENHGEWPSAVKGFEPGKVELIGSMDCYDEVACFPWVKPRRNGRPWGSRVLKKKRKKNWDRLIKMLESRE